MRNYMDGPRPILATRIEKLRKEKKMTQKEVAEKLNISRSAYSQYEIGKKEPRIYTLIAIADLYKVSIDYLVGRLN